MKGILFKDWKVKAIVGDDREWQTRRLGGLKEINKEPDKWILYDFHSAHGVVTHTNKLNSKGQFIFWQAPIFDSPDGSYKYIKPRYQVGEVVYIKEKALYWISPVLEGVEYERPSDWWTDCVYQDDPEIPELLADNGRLVLVRSINQIVEGNSIIGKWEWKSPRHMPEHYARYFIKIADIRVERLLEMTGEDVSAEGIIPHEQKVGNWTFRDVYSDYALLWDSINPKYPWAMNPWVFVYSFKKAEK